jgi:hypothetical protein
MYFGHGNLLHPALHGAPSPPLLDERRGQRGTQERFQACLVRAGQIDRERGGQRFSTGAMTAMRQDGL